MENQNVPAGTGECNRELQIHVLTACRIVHESNIGSVIIEKKNDNNNIKSVRIITERDVVWLLGSRRLVKL